MNVGSSTSSQAYTYNTTSLQRQAPSADDIFAKIMQESDTDGDGSLSADEIASLDERQQQRLLEADEDGDGTVTGDELLGAIAAHIEKMQQMGPPSADELVSKIMQDADTDGDGVISAAELSAVDERQLQKLSQADTDGDGIITEEELSTQISQEMASGSMPPPPPPESMSMNDFKGMLASRLQGDEDTLSQIQTYLSDAGLQQSQIDDVMTMLEQQRFDVSA